MSFDLHERQLTWETQSLQEGYDRYIRHEERLKEDQGLNSTNTSRKIIKGCLSDVVSKLKVYLETASNNGKGRTPTALSYLKDLEIESLALIALSAVFNGIGREATAASVCITAGRMVENELWALGLKDRDGDLYKRLVERAMRTHGNVGYRRKAMRATAAKEGYQPEPLTNDMRAVIGAPLVNAVLEGCPEVFMMFTTQGEADSERHIGLTEEASKFIAELTFVEAWMAPQFKPMLVPPKPWVAFDTGCYLSDALSRSVPLVRTYNREHKALVKQAIESGLMQPCLQSLNVIQNTRWRINKRMLAVVKWAWEAEVILDSFPQRFHLKKPENPRNWETLSDNEKKAYRIRVSSIAKRNRGIDGEKVVMLQDLAVADELADVEAFYIPHSLDFRGRVYPVCHFSQQRAGHIKSLLEFADGVPLGDEGAYWLAIHLANCADFDKLSKKPLDERVEWVSKNHALITQIANDPEGTFDLWKSADDPFQFVAACIDFNGYLKNGNDHVSHLAVALDGSNSGLQHYSAALRSPEGALVCLTPSEKPADVYQAVCDRAKSIVEADATKGDEMAKVVLKNGVTRSLVKRNVMTFAYSSEQYGFAKQHQKDLMQPLALKVLEGQLVEHPYGIDNGFKASIYIAKVVWRAVNEIVKDASSGMRFFQRCAQVLAHERKGLHWITPVGLPVFHKYNHWDVKQVRLFLYDQSVPVVQAKTNDKVEGDNVLKRIAANIRVKPNERINKEKAKSAVAPNVIHSMDAAHLMLTVLQANFLGISSFSLIHDSFGTHAANTTRFFLTIRESFVDMYENYDPFEEIHYQTDKALEDKTKTPQLPARGNLDLSQVIDSLYAFA